MNRPLRSPVARALFSSKLGRAARVVTEGSVPAGVEDGIPVSSENGIPVSLEDGVPVNMEDGIPVGAGGGTSGSLEKEFLGGSADGDPLRPGSGIPAEQARGTATGTEGSGFEKEGEALEEANGEVQRESLPGDRPKNEETAPNTKSVTEAESCSENANELSVIEPEQRSTEECPGEGTEPLAEPASQPHSYPGHSDQPSVAPLAECSVKKAELTEECPGEGTESLADPKSEPRSYSSEIDQPPVILLVEPPVETPDQAEQPGLCPSIVAPEGEAISGEEQPATSGQGLAEEAVSVSVFNGEPAGLTEEAMTVSVLNDWEPTAPGQGLTEEAVTASVTAEGAASNHETGHVLETSVPHHQKLAVSARQGPDASDLDELTVSTKEGSGSAPEVLALPFPVPELRALSGEAPKSPPPGPHSERVAPSVELCPDEEASLVADQEILVQSNQESPAVPCQDTQLPRSKEAPGVTTDEAPAAAEPEKPTDGPEELSEPEGIPPPEQSPEPAAAGGGVMGLFARMRARQAAVVAMLDSPVKSQPSPDPESAADGRLERPGDIPRERLEQPGIKEEGPGVKEEGCGVKEEEPEVRKEQPGGKEEHSRVRVEVETESRAESGDKEEGPGVHPRTENEGKKGEASDRGNQPGLELKREIEQSRDQSETEQRPGSASEEKELKGGEERNEAGSGSGDRSQDTDDPLGPENVTGGPDRAERSEAKEGADVRLSEVVSLPLAGFSLPETKDAKCVEVETSAEDPGNVVTVLGVSGPNETSPVASPGVKSPVSAAWEEAWFGTPVSKPGLAQPGAGLERTCLTEGKEQSPGDGTGGKETGRETQSTANEDAASVSLEPPTSADVSARRDDACESGDDVSSAPGVTAYGVDGAPKAQSGDSLSTEASSTGGFTPRASPARGGRGSGRKPSPKTPSPILSLAIPPFESPQTPVDEPRQTLESQFEDEAGKGEMDAQWDACVARFGGRKRTSPASLPQGPPGRRTPMRHSAEDLWSYLGEQTACFWL